MKKYVKATEEDIVITTVEELQDEMSRIAKEVGGNFAPQNDDRCIGWIGTSVANPFYYAIDIYLDDNTSLDYTFRVSDGVDIPTYHGIPELSRDSVIESINETWDLFEAFSEIKFDIEL